MNINEFKLRAIIRLKYYLLKNKIWKNKLKENGIGHSPNLNDPDFMDMSINIFNSLFNHTNKDKTIDIKSVSKTYDNSFKAVNNFNLEIKSGEFVCLLGPSGCGKTTLLRMLAGFENITEGKYLMGGSSMNDLPPSDRDTAMVFQNYALYPFMNVYKNIAFGLNLKTFKNTLLEQKINEYMLIRKPYYNQIKDAEFKIHLLKKPHEELINSLKIKIKKLSFNKQKNQKEIHKTSIELERAIAEHKNAKNKNAKEILEVEKQINKLKTEQNALVKKLKEDEKENNKTIVEQVKKLEVQEKEYFAKKTNEYAKISKELKEDQAKQKSLKKELSTIFKSGLREVKVASKNPSSSDNEIQIIKEKFNKKLNKANSQLDELKSKIKKQRAMMTIIKNSKRVEINALKHKGQVSKSLLNEALEGTVVWKKTIPARVRNLARMSGIENYLQRKPSALSGGQRQRVALIRAISKDAQLFLFDEPLSNLDAKLRGTMRSEIRKIHDASNATSLYVTHDQIEAMTMATKVVVMNVGYALQIGSPSDLYENPSSTFVAKFIGSPSINFLKVKINSLTEAVVNDFKIPMKFKAAKQKVIESNKLKGKDVFLGIRPQDIKVSTTKNKNALEVKVLSTELIGAEQVLKLSFNKKNMDVIHVTASNEKIYKKDQTLYVEFNSEKMHLFDVETGMSLSSILNQETIEAQKNWLSNSNARIINKILLADKSKDKNGISNKAIKLIKNAMSQDKKNKYLSDKLKEKTIKHEDYSLTPINNKEINS